MLVHWVGLEIERISVFGNTARLGSRSAPLVFLWLMWFYFLVRYYQHFRDLRDRGLKAAYLDRLRPIAEERAWRVFFTHSKAQFGAEASQVGARTFYGSVVTPTRCVITIGTQIQSPSERHVIKKQITVTEWQLVVPRIQCLMHVAFNTSLGTEYILPFVVALAPIAVYVALSVTE